MLHWMNFSIVPRAGGAILLSFILSLWLGRICLKRFKETGVVDYFRADSPSMHRAKKGIPTAGGIFIILSLILSLIIFADLSNKLIMLALTVMLCLALVGFWDDWMKISQKSSRGLRVKYKLAIQLSLAAIIALYLFLDPKFNTQLEVPFAKINLNIGWLYIPLIMSVIVGTSNAVNLTDGLDGLAAGCLIFTGFAYAILAYLTGDASLSRYFNITYIPEGGEFTILWAAIIGATLGFLWYNCYPAKIIMGDTGAQALGGALGITAVLLKKEILLLLVGGIFVIEALSVMLQVASFKLRGKRILRMSPIHHHYELKGMEEPKIVTRFWVLAILGGLVGLSSLLW